MEWIKVEDRLPEEGSCVFCYPSLESHLFGVVDECGIYNKFTSFDYRSEIWSEDRVTHWMPLPEPPKE